MAAAPSQDSASATAGEPAPAPTAPPAEGRRVRFNARELDQTGWAVLQQIEAATRSHIPDGDYWYDPPCGAAGMWGGPALAFLPAGLPLGGGRAGPGLRRRQRPGLRRLGQRPRAAPSATSRCLRRSTVCAPQPGRYWVDAAGNAGYEGGPRVRQPDPGRAPALRWRRRRRQLVSADLGAGGDMYGGSDGQSTYFFDSASGCSVMHDGGGAMCRAARGVPPRLAGQRGAGLRTPRVAPFVSARSRRGPRRGCRSAARARPRRASCARALAASQSLTAT